MNEQYDHKKLSEDEYLKWLDTYLSLLKDFTMLLETSSAPSPYSDAATMISFLRAAEHVFNYFINHRLTYKMNVYSEEMEKLIPAVEDAPQMTYDNLKIERDKVADRIARIIESDPKTRKRFEEFCDNLKEPRAFGFCL